MRQLEVSCEDGLLRGEDLVSGQLPPQQPFALFDFGPLVEGVPGICFGASGLVAKLFIDPAEYGLVPDDAAQSGDNGQSCGCRERGERRMSARPFASAFPGRDWSGQDRPAV